MSSKQHHRGIHFSVEPVGNQRWRWQIHPPTCVVGMCEEAGELNGAKIDAVQAAHRAIEAQIGLH